MAAFPLTSAFLFAGLMAACGAAARQPTVRAVCPMVEPWGYQETEEGAACSFMDYVARSADLLPRTEVQPIPRIIHGLRDGTTDLTILVPSPERLELGISLCEPSDLTISIAYYKNSIASDSVEAFEGTRVGTFRNGALLKEFFNHGAEPVDLLTMTQGFKMLAAHRLTGTVCVRPGCDRAIRNAGIPPDELSMLPVESFPFSLLLSKQSPLAQDAGTVDKLRAACQSPATHRILDGLIREFE